MFIVTRIWISISDLDLNSIIESHNENLKNLVNFIIIIIKWQMEWARLRFLALFHDPGTSEHI